MENKEKGVNDPKLLKQQRHGEMTSWGEGDLLRQVSNVHMYTRRRGRMGSTRIRRWRGKGRRQEEEEKISPTL